MMVAGITGGMGSGKSMVSRIFRQLGIPVYDADEAARGLYDRYPELVAKIRAELGEEVLDAKGAIDRKKLAAVVFQDDDKLKALNKLVHPMVRKDFKEWSSHHRAAPYIMKEAAILFESGTHKDCDVVITVTANPELRLQRVRNRDQRTVAEIKKVMEKQWSDEEKIRRSDFVIRNNENDAVLPQVLHIHDQLVKRSREKMASGVADPR